RSEDAASAAVARRAKSQGNLGGIVDEIKSPNKSNAYKNREICVTGRLRVSSPASRWNGGS
ncbi:MAG: hypothetical protein K8F58_03925, partial [Bauldia sp.]|nr:hypothetical protein [Bauldia sp.]